MNARACVWGDDTLAALRKRHLLPRTTLSLSFLHTHTRHTNTHLPQKRFCYRSIQVARVAGRILVALFDRRRHDRRRRRLRPPRRLLRYYSKITGRLRDRCVRLPFRRCCISRRYLARLAKLLRCFQPRVLCGSCPRTIQTRTLKGSTLVL